MISVARLFGKDRLTSGTRVSVINDGQKYNGIVASCDYSSDKYMINFHKRFVKEEVYVERKRHQIMPVDESIIDMVEVSEYDYEDEFLINSMM